MNDLSHCAIHTITTKTWSLQQAIAGYAAAGIGGICVWRDALQAAGVENAARMIKESGLAVPSLVRGGFFPAIDGAKRQAAVDENRRCIDEARGIGAEQIVMVVGAVPGMALEEARKWVAEGLAAVLPYAQQAMVKLAIEPLHPMYAADRSCINRMAEARKICEQLQHPLLGIAADVYHIWWDPDLKSEIELAGKQKTLFGFHVCDWKVSSTHPLNDRGLMGDGCIDIKTIRGWVEATGFSGFNEVEVFSESFWAMDPTQYVQLICERFKRFV